MVESAYVVFTPSGKRGRFPIGASILACAWGKPSDAFGKMYTPFDTTRRVARLPGPPYDLLHRVTPLAAGAKAQ